MKYLDETGKKLLCDAIDAQVRELDRYLVETLNHEPDALFESYTLLCIDSFVTEWIELELNRKLEINENSEYDKLSKAITSFAETAALLWWASGGMYEGKAELGDDESMDSPIDYLFLLMSKASIYNGIVKALADIAASKKSQSKKAAKARWDLDPRTEEKALVKSCWLEWRAEPARYKSKSAFLRDMHQKLENLALNRSTLNDWIKSWSMET